MQNVKEKFGKFLAIILKEMCRKVNCDYDKFDFNQKDWFMKYTWNDEEQDIFKKWLINYMNGSKNARVELMTIPVKRKEYIEKFVDIFILNYGWKCKW